MKEKAAAGIDIGGTKIGAAAVKDGEVISDIIKIETPGSVQGIIDGVISVVKELRQDYELTDIGIATAGVVNIQTGQVTSATENLARGYAGTNFREILVPVFSVPVSVENDANAAAIAEHRYGAAQGAKNSITVTLGTGIGTGIIINNKLYHGKNYAGGECGHMVINLYRQRPCNCGKYDCWEVYASGTGLTVTARATADKYNQPIQDYDSHAVIQRLHEDNPLIQEIYHTWLYHLSIGLINLNNIFDPDVIVLGGSMAAFVDYNRLVEMMRGRAPFDVQVKKGELGNLAGIIGAVC